MHVCGEVCGQNFSTVKEKWSIEGPTLQKWISIRDERIESKGCAPFVSAKFLPLGKCIVCPIKGDFTKKKNQALYFS